MKIFLIIFLFCLSFQSQLFAAGQFCSPNKITDLLRQSKKEDLLELDTLLNQKAFDKSNMALYRYQKNYNETPKVINKATQESTTDSLIKVKEDGTWVIRRSNGYQDNVPNGAATYAIQKRLTDPAFFHDKTRAEIQNYPKEVRSELGKAIFDLQNGKTLGMPLSKMLPSVGPGVSELRVKTRHGNYRVFYYKNSSDGVIVFHSFTKKTQDTPKHEIEVGRKRLREMLGGNP